MKLKIGDRILFNFNTGSLKKNRCYRVSLIHKSHFDDTPVYEFDGVPGGWLFCDIDPYIGNGIEIISYGEDAKYV